MEGGSRHSSTLSPEHEKIVLVYVNIFVDRLYYRNSESITPVKSEGLLQHDTQVKS